MGSAGGLGGWSGGPSEAQGQSTQGVRRAKPPETERFTVGAPAGFKNVDAQPVGSGASLREMIRNIDNYFAIV